MDSKELSARQLAIITHRIEQAVGWRNLAVHVPIAHLFQNDEDRYNKVVQLLWDEYQFKPDPIDTIKDIAYILQQKIQVNPWKNT